jgi:hypothetical protein
MKIKLLILWVLFAFVFASRAQSNLSKKKPEVISFNGYVIQLFQTSAGGYGYDIFKQHVIILHQDINPYTSSAAGIKLKADAVKTAKWQIIHLDKTNHQSQIVKQIIPVEVASQLNITLDK